MRKKIVILSYVQKITLLLLLTVLLTVGFAEAQGEQNPDIPPGTMIIEGDIIVPDDFYTAEATWTTSLWPGGIVPYVFSANVTATNQNRMIAAMAEWEAVATVDFRPRTAEANYIFIQSSTENTSWVGVQGGSQTVNIASWTSRFIIAHELAHALGEWHEQNRPNRNSFVSININCVQVIPQNMRHNYTLQSTAGQYPSGGYDFDSVMHYGQAGFLDTTLPGCANVTRIITVLAPNQSWQNQIGQRTHLSTMDQLGMSFLYPQANWRFANRNYTGLFELGTFIFPAKTFALGYTLTPTGGTLWIEPGTYTGSAGTYNKAMTVNAPRGGVTIQ